VNALYSLSPATVAVILAFDDLAAGRSDEIHHFGLQFRRHLEFIQRRAKKINGSAPVLGREFHPAMRYNHVATDIQPVAAGRALHKIDDKLFLTGDAVVAAVKPEAPELACIVGTHFREERFDH